MSSLGLNFVTFDTIYNNRAQSGLQNKANPRDSMMERLSKRMLARLVASNRGKESSRSSPMKNLSNKTVERDSLAFFK